MLLLMKTSCFIYTLLICVKNILLIMGIITGVFLGLEKQSKFCSVVSDKQRSSLLTPRQSHIFDSN